MWLKILGAYTVIGVANFALHRYVTRNFYDILSTRHALLPRDHFEKIMIVAAITNGIFWPGVVPSMITGSYFVNMETASFEDQMSALRQIDAFGDVLSQFGII